MSAWWTKAAEQLAAGRPCVLVTVATVEGSAPREAGAKMLVWDEGQEGTVGGGKLEYTIVEQARRMLTAGTPWRFQHYPLGPLLGQCCGGRVGILLERLETRSVAWLADIAAAEDTGKPYAILSALDADRIVKQVLSPDAGPPVSVQGAPDGPITGRIGEGFTIIERIDPRPRLLMFGAGHVGQALFPIAVSLPFDVRWFDTRQEFAATGAAITGDLEALAEQAPPGSFYLIFTQSHDLDYRLARAVLRRADFAYCGLIGSATKRARFEKRLLADGVRNLARLTCPIGAIGLTSKLPQVMAVAVAAELLLVLERMAGLRTAPRRASHGG